MLVTSMLPVTKGRTKVYIDDNYYFALYAREIARYQLKIGQPVETELVDHILSEVVLKRAKSKALSLLKLQDRTEADIRKKLRLSYYREDIIDFVIEYLYGYHYLDDYRYSVQYISCKQNCMSQRQIKNKLLEKGVSKDVVEQAMSEFEDDAQETELIQKILDKRIKGKDVSEMSQKEWNKQYQYLLYKGFSSSDISSVLRQYQDKFF